MGGREGISEIDISARQVGTRYPWIVRLQLGEVGVGEGYGSRWHGVVVNSDLASLLQALSIARLQIVGEREGKEVSKEGSSRKAHGARVFTWECKSEDFI